MQEGFERNDDGLNEFFEWLVWLGGTKSLCLILTLSFMMMDKASSLYLWSTSITMYFFGNILESLYAEQRLYMMTSDVKTTLCFTGFGNPSDEVLMNCFVHISLLLHALQVNEKKFQRRPALRRTIQILWPILAGLFLSLHAFGLVALGANSFNQVIFGATLGFTMAIILYFWVKSFFINLQSRLTKKQMGVSHQGDEVYEDRYMLRFKHLIIVILLTLVLPLAIAVYVLNSFGEEIDEDFKDEVILQKIWLGNDCPIDLSDASEILQYKHFVCECTIVGLFGAWLGQFTEWFFLSNRGLINQSPWIWHQTTWSKLGGRLVLAIGWFFANLSPAFLFDASSF